MKINEATIMDSYEPLLNKIVNNFTARTTLRTVPREDLMQEARIAFLKHIRTHMPEEYHLCRLTILHALCDAVQRQYPLSMPRAVYLAKEKRAPLFIVNFEKAEEELTVDGNCEAVDLMNEIMQAVERFPKEAMELVKLKLNGYSNREAAQQLCMTDARVSRMLKQIRRLLDDAA